MSFQLRDGSKVKDRRLDRLPQQDLRSLNYLVGDRLGVAVRAPLGKYWTLNTYLDQGTEGACVGFGFGHELRSTPVPVTGVSNTYARQTIYWGAQKIDPWAGGAYPGASPFYEGTSVLAGAKRLQNLGFYSGYSWGISMREVCTAISYLGPAVLGLDWWTGMFNVNSAGFIRPTGSIAGGHCILAVGVKYVFFGTGTAWSNVDTTKSYLVLHNSWGSDWGLYGRARLSLKDFSWLLSQGGEACFPVRTTKLSV